MKRALLLGAHTAVAQALRECLEEREVEIDLVLTTTSEHVAGGLMLIDEAQMKAADLIILAMGGDLGLELAGAARALGKPVLDLTEGLVDEEGAHWIFPGRDADVGGSFDPTRPAVIPIGLGVPVVTAIGALAPLEPTRAAVITQESTSAFGQPGMDELSEQIRARFNMRDVEPKVLPATVGFGVIPSVAPRGAPAVDADDVLRAALEAGLEPRFPELELFVTRMLVPTFSADSALVLIDVSKDVDEPEVRRLLREGRGLHVADEDEILSSADSIGRDDAIVGRVQTEAGRVGLWLASDRLRRGSATLAALVLERFVAGR